MKQIFIYFKILISNFYKLPDVIDYFTCRLAPKWAYPKLLAYIFKRNIGYNLNLFNPKTFNEKIQYLKLFDNDALKSTLSDKIEVQKYVKDVLGENHIKKIYKIYNSIEEINIDELPETFYLKANHGCKMQYFIPNKQFFIDNYEEIKSHFSKWLKMDFAFVNGFELQYSPIKPKIFAEEYIKNPDSEFPVDIEIFCFNGVPQLISVREIFEELSYGISLYTADCKLLPYHLNRIRDLNNVPIVLLPLCINELLDKAKLLSKGFKMVRVDFSYTKNNYYFGELTFTPYSGYYEMPCPELDKMLCDWCKL